MWCISTELFVQNTYQTHHLFSIPEDTALIQGPLCDLVSGLLTALADSGLAPPTPSLPSSGGVHCNLFCVISIVKSLSLIPHGLGILKPTGIFAFSLIILGLSHQ
ncbi:unnamed protein product [Rangifer tarandus platyrhynchus]|uniref:Uncharacterized protein n=1 Tax=Rangifer tarandus platyrhynchus TaxID=3082113 RepID=A0ABN8XPE5_RANTA|nr:unnamed protein product [Rangifer tarandus platyrhynchus]CAI9155122.1 unnamed protein product [Rangifer tarandus platyrhynchus]